jgi:hypothetical protein
LTGKVFLPERNPLFIPQHSFDPVSGGYVTLAAWHPHQKNDFLDERSRFRGQKTKQPTRKNFHGNGEDEENALLPS